MAPGLSRIARALVGRTEVLMVDMETREVVVVRADDGEDGPGLSVHEVPPVPGDGPIVEVSGVQGDDGAWVVAGTECHSIETYGPDECDPGVPTVAVWDDGEWALVEAPPPSLTGAAVPLRGIAAGTALVEARRGADTEAFWVLDIGDATLHQVAWAPPPVEPPDDGGPGSHMTTRSTCLAGDRLVSVEARPSADGGRFDTRIVVVGVSERSGVVLVDAPVDLGDGHVPERVLCDGGSDVDGGAGSVHVIAHDRSVGLPVAHEVDLETGFVAGAVGPGTAVFSSGAAGPTTFTSVPGEPDALAARTTPGTAEALLWADGGWSHLGPEAGFDTDDRLLPVAGTVVAWTPSTGRFRLPEERPVRR